MFEKKYIIVVAIIVLFVGVGLYFNTTKPSQIEDTANVPSEKVVVEALTEEVGNPLVSEKISELEAETVITTTEPSLTDTKEDQNTVLADEPKPEVEIVVVRTELPEYISSPKGLLQNESLLYVFIGKIVEKTGQVRKKAGTTTQYIVHVLQTIHKDVSGNIVLNQSGVGYLADGRFIARDGDMSYEVSGKITPDDIYLKTGATYLFATLSSEGKEFTISAAPYDRELITTDTTLSDAQLKALADQNPRVQEFKQAVVELGL